MIMLKIILLFALFTALRADVLQLPFSGTTYESCSTEKDCRNGWSCLSLNGKETCSDSSCSCFPKKFKSCKDKKECPFGETCARSSQDPFHCVSDGSDPDIFLLADGENEATPSPTCEPQSGDPGDTGFPSDSVLSYGRCRLSKDCKGDRKCYSSSGSCCSEGSFSCYCLDQQPAFCESSSDCDSGESCVASRVAPPRCMDTKVRDSIGFEEFETGAICIDADALSHLQPHELVFEKHQIARVLCDVEGSCATAGHIVVYNGRSMMMRTYCDIVSCTSEIKRVNSPSWRKGIRIASRSEGLEYSAFAARWATRAEEHVLTLAMRAGL